MFELNEYVLHNLYGVLQVIDFEDIVFNGVEQKYYVLQSPFRTNLTAKLKIPVNKSNLLRELPKEDKIHELIKSLNDVEPIWIAESKNRIKVYETIFMESDIVELCAYLKALKAHKEVIKLTIKDREFMKRAEQIIYGIFSVGLGIDYADVPGYIENECPNSNI